MPLTAIVFWITYVSGVCAALFNPVVGMALYVLVYHINPETQWWGDSARAVGLRASFTVAIAAGLGVLIRNSPHKHGARQFPKPYALALAFGLVAIGSMAWGLEITDRGMYQAEKYVKLMIVLFILIRCVRTPAHYHLIVTAWVVGVLYMGYQASGGMGQVVGGRLTAGVGGPDFDDSSALAVHLVATLPLIGATFFTARTWLGRGFALVAGALTVNTLVLTRTRNAIAGLVVIAISTVLCLPRGYRLKGIAAVVVGTLLAMQLADPAWWKRMSSVSDYANDESAMLRIAIWSAALQMSADYPLGIGLGNFHQTVLRYVPQLTDLRSAHNTLITCVTETGWVGLLLLLSIFSIVLWRLGRVRRIARELPPITDIHIFRWRTRFHLGWHALALRAGLLGYLAGAMFTTRLFAEDLWLMLGLAMCLDNVSKGMVAQEAHDAAVVPGAPRQDAAAAIPALPATARDEVMNAPSRN